jgi:hypothetical protein
LGSKASALLPFLFMKIVLDILDLSIRCFIAAAEALLKALSLLFNMMFADDAPDKEIRTRYENGEKITEIRHRR